MLAPERKENRLGLVEVRKVFRISQGRHGRRLHRSLDGVVRRGAQVRVLRDSVVVHDGELDSLKRFKDDVREVKARLRVRPVAQELQRRPGGRPARGLRDRRGRAHAVAARSASPIEREATFAARAAHRRADPARARGAAPRRGEGPARRAGDDHRGRGVARPVAREGLLHRISPAASTPTRPSRRSQRTAGFLRSELAHRLQLYTVPQLHFDYDDSIEPGMRLSQLIDEAVAADRKPRRR